MSDNLPLGNTLDLQEQIELELEKADERGEIKWIKNMTPEEAEKWSNEAHKFSDIIPLYSNGAVIAYQVIPEPKE